MRIIQKTINHFFSLNTYPLSFVIIQQQISADRLLGEKSVSRLSRICKGEHFWNPKVENFFLSVWKKAFTMNGTSEAQALRREQARGTEEGNKALAWGDFCCVLFCFEIILWALFTSKRKKKLTSSFFFFNCLCGVFMVDA